MRKKIVNVGNEGQQTMQNSTLYRAAGISSRVLSKRYQRKWKDKRIYLNFNDGEVLVAKNIVDFRNEQAIFVGQEGSQMMQNSSLYRIVPISRTALL